jgi:hypothetical protein
VYDYLALLPEDKPGALDGQIAENTSYFATSALEGK